MMTEPKPKADARTVGGVNDDVVLQLREWGTENTHLLPRLPGPHWISVGRHRSCSIRLRDRWRRVSRFHAELVYADGKWLLRDLNSTNGIQLYGVRTTEVWLAPGDEIQIGYLTLIAESRRTIELRAYLFRLLGWHRSQLEAVDEALRSIYTARTGRAVLVLCGEDDLVPVARSLHRHMLGRKRPFIVCDPARCQVNDPARSLENCDDGVPALDAAAGGTLCVRHERLPHDFAEVTAALADPSAQVQLVVCARSAKYCARYLSLPIIIPPLIDRVHEIERVIDEYAVDAFLQLRSPETRLSPEDQEWVRLHAASSIAAIEKATLRLAAIRTSLDVCEAAARLAMSPLSLARWIERRRLPMGVACSCCDVD